jgi:hypothetical protein
MHDRIIEISSSTRARRSRIIAFLVLGALFSPVASSARAQIKLQTVHGDAAADNLGADAHAAGDVDGDGVVDYVAGAPLNDFAGFAAGEAIVFSGVDGSVLYRFYGSAANDQFGASVCGAGDVNGDGYADIIVGSRYFDVGDTSGNAVVYSGQNGSVLYTFLGTVDPNFISSPVAGVGDINGDGYDDVIVGEPLISAGGLARGRARVHSGLDGSILQEHTGGDLEQMGRAVGVAGDVDHDGHPDFIVGGRDNLAPGRAWVFSGADGHVLHLFASTRTLDGFGQSVAGAGDVNGDGYADLIVGSPEDATDGAAAGAAYVYSGADGMPLHTFHGGLALARMGTDVAAGGDYDGDGYADVLVSEEKDFGVPQGTGSAHLYSGIDGHLLKWLASRVPNDGFGSAIDVLGDMNGDGRLDYLAGARLGDTAATDLGTAYVMSLVGIYSNYCTASPNSSGAPALIHGDGYATFSNNDLVLTVTQLPLHTTGLFLMSDMRAAVPLGNGFLCLRSPIYRLYPGSSSGSTGTASKSISLNVAPMLYVIHVGQTWNFQLWFRDIPGGGAGTNLSDALQVTFLP